VSASLLGRKDDERKGRLPLIRCNCGAEILVLLSLERMNEAIEKHVKKHERRLKDKRDKEVEAQLIREFLSAQMFERLTEKP
jgi:hypothetical protein